MKLLMYIWQRKVPIIIGGLICVLLYFAYNCYQVHYTDSIDLSLVYPGSEKGVYPDNTRFNIYDILNTEVIDAAVESYNAESNSLQQITSDDVRGDIIINESAPADLQDRIDEARMAGQDYSYFVNEYRIEMKPVHKLTLSTAFGTVPYVDGEKFLNHLYTSFSQYLVEQHAEENIIPRLEGSIDYEGYDYLEYANMLNNQISTYINYLQPKNAENGGFYSDETGLTFEDLITEFTNLQTYQIQSLISYVSSSGLAKDTQEFINILETNNEKDFIEYQKTRSEGEISTQAMYAYDHTFEENIVIPTYDADNGLYQARPKTGYDDITQRALEHQVEADNMMTDINENSRKIEFYSASLQNAEEHARITAVADSMMAELETASSELIAKADLTVQEYLRELSSDYVSQKVVPKSYVNISLSVDLLGVFIAAGFAVLVIVVIIEGVRRWYIVFVQTQKEAIMQERRLQVLENVKEGESIPGIDSSIAEDVDKLTFGELVKHRFRRSKGDIRFAAKDKTALKREKPGKKRRPKRNEKDVKEEK